MCVREADSRPDCWLNYSNCILDGVCVCVFLAAVVSLTLAQGEKTVLTPVLVSFTTQSLA